MTEERDDKIARAGEYALGVMPPDDAKVFEHDLSRDAYLREIYADWAEGLVALDGDGQKPSAKVKKRLDRKLFGAPRGRGAWIFKGLIPALTCTFVVYTLYNHDFVTFDLGAQSTTDTLAFNIRADVDSRLIRASYLTEVLPDDRDHELWIIPEDGVPISLGVLDRGRVTVPGDFDLNGAVIAVSVEQDGGSPTGQPTTTPVAVVPLTSL